MCKRGRLDCVAMIAVLVFSAVASAVVALLVGHREKTRPPHIINPGDHVILGSDRPLTHSELRVLDEELSAWVRKPGELNIVLPAGIWIEAVVPGQEIRLVGPSGP